MVMHVRHTNGALIEAPKLTCGERHSQLVLVDGCAGETLLAHCRPDGHFVLQTQRTGDEPGRATGLVGQTQMRAAVTCPTTVVTGLHHALGPLP